MTSVVVFAEDVRRGQWWRLPAARERRARHASPVDWSALADELRARNLSAPGLLQVVGSRVLTSCMGGGFCLKFVDVPQEKVADLAVELRDPHLQSFIVRFAATHSAVLPIPKWRVPFVTVLEVQPSSDMEKLDAGKYGVVPPAMDSEMYVSLCAVRVSQARQGFQDAHVMSDMLDVLRREVWCCAHTHRALFARRTVPIDFGRMASPMWARHAVSVLTLAVGSWCAAGETCAEPSDDASYFVLVSWDRRFFTSAKRACTRFMRKALSVEPRWRDVRISPPGSSPSPPYGVVPAGDALCTLPVSESSGKLPMSPGSLLTGRQHVAAFIKSCARLRDDVRSWVGHSATPSAWLARLAAVDWVGRGVQDDASDGALLGGALECIGEVGGKCDSLHAVAGQVVATVTESSLDDRLEALVLLSTVLPGQLTSYCLSAGARLVCAAAMWRATIEPHGYTYALAEHLLSVFHVPSPNSSQLRSAEEVRWRWRVAGLDDDWLASSPELLATPDAVDMFLHSSFEAVIRDRLAVCDKANTLDDLIKLACLLPGVCAPVRSLLSGVPRHAAVKALAELAALAAGVDDEGVSLLEEAVADVPCGTEVPLHDGDGHVFKVVRMSFGWHPTSGLPCEGSDGGGDDAGDTDGDASGDDDEVEVGEQVSTVSQCGLWYHGTTVGSAADIVEWGFQRLRCAERTDFGGWRGNWHSFYVTDDDSFGVECAKFATTTTSGASRLGRVHDRSDRPLREVPKWAGAVLEFDEPAMVMSRQRLLELTDQRWTDYVRASRLGMGEGASAIQSKFPEARDSLFVLGPAVEDVWAEDPKEREFMQLAVKEPRTGKEADASGCNAFFASLRRVILLPAADCSCSTCRLPASSSGGGQVAVSGRSSS